MDVIVSSAKYDVWKRCGEAGQMSLGELVARLEAGVDKSKVVLVGEGMYAQTFHSYRGHYDHIALSYAADASMARLVVEILRDAAAAIGSMLEGYKGGEFKMTRLTPVWISPYGKSSRMGLVAVEDNLDHVLLRSERIADIDD
jgi:hypothetical protein